MPPRRRSYLPDRPGQVVGLPWADFQAFMRVHWRPGQHWALIAPTGAGKSTFAAGLLELRRYVLALDPKGGDSTLETSGYQRLTSWPPPSSVFNEIAEGKPARFIVGAKVRTADQRPWLRETFRRTLIGAFDMGGFTVYVDEFQILADRKMMNLGPEVETFLIAARDKASSVLTAYQAPAWVPTAASRQATWVAVWPTMDLDVVKKLAQITGRRRQDLEAAIEALPEFHVLVAGRNPRHPLIVTSAPER